MTDEKLMRIAIDEALKGAAEGEPPFGALVVESEGRIVAREHDTVRADGDMTRHAESKAVRRACKLRGPDLGGCTLVTTCEPCPMCFTTAWLARISRLVFGCTMSDAISATGGNQRELNVNAETLNARSGSPLEITGSVLAGECLALFTVGRVPKCV